MTANQLRYQTTLPIKCTYTEFKNNFVSGNRKDSMMRFSSILSLLSAFFLTGLPVSSIAAETSATIGSPYGICAHLNRWEYDRMPQELELIRQAGIRHVRTDLDWNQIEPEKGK